MGRRRALRDPRCVPDAAHKQDRVGAVGEEEKQERLEAKSRMAVVLRQTRASAHVARDLQYLPAAVNTSKSNKRPPPGYLDWAGQHDNEPLRAAVAGEWGGFGEEYYD